MKSKLGEIKYVEKLNSQELDWLRTKPFGDFKVEESFLRLRDFSYIEELLQIEGHKHLAILDLGCGPGWTSIFLAKMGLAVTGIDISPAMIKIAKERAAAENVKVNFKVADIEKNQFTNQFDRVLIYDALHHCPNEIKVLKNAYQSLVPGGLILIVEPNLAHQYNPEAQKIAKRFGILEKGYTPAHLGQQMKKIGFKKITRYHCHYGLNKPVPQGLKSFLNQLVRLFASRLVLAHFRSQVWLLGRK